MHSKVRVHIQSNLIGYLGVFLPDVGTVYAADKIRVGGQDIKRGAVKTRHVKNGTLLATDFASGQLPNGAQGAPGAPGNPGQDATVPAGAVQFFNLATCPAGWSEMTAARGRYLVGLPTGGTLAGTQGTALSNLENRAAGQHTHGVTDPGHAHRLTLEYGQADATDPTSVSGLIDQALLPLRLTNNLQTTTEQTGITINTAGSVAGTNSPYIQLLVCQKS